MIQVEQSFEGVEHLVATPASHPAFGHLELILHHAEHGSAGSASGGQAHGRIMPSPASALRTAVISTHPLLSIADFKVEPRRVGRPQLFDLPLEDARQHQ